jgi:DNA helicase MCM8
MRGTVVRISSVKPLITQMAFMCNACDTARVVKFEDGKYALPTKCSAAGCRSKSFRPDRESADTIAVDWQKIRSI